MDYPIEPITTIEELGRSARLLGLPPSTCPYAQGSEHWRRWQVGYRADLMSAINAAFSSAANGVVA